VTPKGWIVLAVAATIVVPLAGRALTDDEDVPSRDEQLVAYIDETNAALAPENRATLVRLVKDTCAEEPSTVRLTLSMTAGMGPEVHDDLAGGLAIYCPDKLERDS
jgi:hypothetical protein